MILASTQAVAWREDEGLVAASRTGEAAAFAVLVDRYQESLFRYLVRHTNNAEVAADLSQDVFLAVYRQLDRLDRDTSFRAYLFGVARNLLKMEWRRSRLHRIISLEWLSERTRVPQAGLRTSGGEDAYHEYDAVQRALAELNPILSEALLLHSSVGFTASEMAQVLSISVPAAEKRLSRAKREFRARYLEMESGRRHD